jgi:hypothetical protein
MTYHDYENDFENDSNNLKKQHFTNSAFQKLNNNYEKYSIPFNKIWIDGKFYKRITIKNYGSGCQGTRIINAVTGTKYNIKVGSAEENIFFKVTDSSGINGRNEPLMLYYDSPEQYENHYFTNVSQDTKQQWIQRSLLFQPKIKTKV